MQTSITLVNEKVNRLYENLVDEEDARVCTDISEDACRYVPVNFFLIILANTLTKLADELSNPKTVLAWLLSFVQAPVYLIGLLVPIRESGSMLPQLLIAAFVRRLAVRKWVWVAGSLVQCGAIIGIGIAAYSLEGSVAGWAIIGLLIVFSLARGLCSVSHKDVLGKTIPKTRRGRLSGVAASLSGLLAIAVGLYFLLQTSSSPLFYLMLLVSAGVLWLLAAGVFALVQEYSGASEGGGNAFSVAIKNLSLLQTDASFRRFVIVRSLLLCSALTAPYYVVLATTREGAGVAALGLFIVANGLASSLSAPVWGRLADASSKTVMIRAALLTATLGIVMYIVVTFVPMLSKQNWIYPLAFFILGIAHSGVRLGRKTYIVDMAGGNKRTDYVAVSNTVIGFILLLTGLIGTLAGLISAAGVILVLSLFGLAGALLANRLPDV